MEFFISDSFTGSLAKLRGDEQKAAKTTAFDLQVNPESPGHKFHKLDRAKDKNFWSVRVNRDIRIIVHRSKSSLLLCYVDHHDRAYKWAEQRKLETHPSTGAAQLVMIRERVEEMLTGIVGTPAEVRETRTPYTADIPQAPPPKTLVFADIEDDTLLGYGVPPDWLAEIKAADENYFLDLTEHLPSEAAEALFHIAAGDEPPTPASTPPSTNPFDHPDSQRRFRVIRDLEEFERALEFPWEKWSIFLHPIQRELVERDFDGPASVSGSAGTGKTIVALHRAAFLARQNPDARVLLTTFSETLAHMLQDKMRRLLGETPRLAERIEIHAMDNIALRLHKFSPNPNQLLRRGELFDLVSYHADGVDGLPFSNAFIFDEWLHVVDAWGLDCWEAYRDSSRSGRRTRLREPQRKKLWRVYEQVGAALRARKAISMAGIYLTLARTFKENRNRPFDHVIVDEAQDIGIPQLQFLAALAGGAPNALFFVGDLGQRIFQSAFSWRSLGIDVRGRTATLKVNYRTSHRIRTQVDRLLDPTIEDADGNVEHRGDTVSAFTGIAPTIRHFNSHEEEIAHIAEWLGKMLEDGVQEQEIGIVVRSEAEIGRAEAALRQAGIAWQTPDVSHWPASGSATLCTMPLVKGLEFRATVVMACDDEAIPSRKRLESAGNTANLEEIYATERHLLYVACTRARDRLLVTSGAYPSEFLEDLTDREDGNEARKSDWEEPHD